MYDIRLEASGYQGMQLLDIDGDTMPKPCVDPNIVLKREWPAQELRENPQPLACEMFHHLWWSFGQDEAWTDQRVITQFDLLSRR